MTPEIHAFEFALGLFSVLIGLAIADVATSFHRLMRAGPAVRWDPLALLAALLAVVFLGSMIDRLPRAVVAVIVSQWIVLVGVPAVLVLLRSRTIHYAGITLLFATVIWHYADQVIT